MQPKKSSFLGRQLSGTSPSTLTKGISIQKSRTFNSSLSKEMLRFDNAEEGLEMLKSSLRKEMDRRNKLKKLFDKYGQIEVQEKKHVKQIKAAIIEIKDATTTCKLKLLVDPTIMVENMIKVETREFLCTLFNTFYKAYANNEKHNEIIGSLNSTLSFMIKGITFSEDQIFNLQKTQLIEQMQVEGLLTTEKNKLKEEVNKKKGIQEMYEITKNIYLEAKEKYESKKKVISELESKLEELNDQSASLEKNIEEQEKLRNEHQSEIDKEILYKEKLTNELCIIKEQVDKEGQESKKSLKKLYETQVSNSCQNWMKKTGRFSQTIPERNREMMRSDLMSEYKNLR